MENENSVTVTANREYKSTTFSMIFRDRKELLELYNVVNRSDYTDPDALEIVTLENAIYNNRELLNEGVIQRLDLPAKRSKCEA